MGNSVTRQKTEFFTRNALIGIGIGLVLGLIAVYLPLEILLAAILGVIVLKYLLHHPAYCILIIIVLTSSIVFEESIPLIPIGIGSLHFSDVLLLVMVGTLGYKYLTEQNFTFTKSPLNLPLLLFVAISLVSAAVAVTRYGADFNDVARQFRLISYYLIFFLITNFITEKSQIKLLIKGLFVIAAVVAAAMIVQAIIGDAIQLMPGRIESASTFGSEFETLRILPPGQTLVFVTFITAICVLVFVPEKPVIYSGYFYLLPLLGTGIILTYNRSYWVAAIFGGTLLFLIAAPENRARLVAMLMILMIFGGSILALFGGTHGKLGTTVDAVSHRFTSIFAGKELSRSGPIDDRRLENAYAIAQIKNHPLLGIGLGNDYRPEIYGPEDRLTYYVHNAYLWLLTDLGIIGFLSFSWFYLLYLVRAAKSWKGISDDFLKSAVAGFMVSGIAILLMALFIPVFMEWFSIVIIATMTGLAETIRNVEAGAEAMD